MSKPSIHVAIALLFNQGKVLVGWRNADQHQGNKHEFPGGKVEKNETPIEACGREVLEEVGIKITQWHKFDFIQHDYEDLQVNLHFFHAYIETSQLLEIQQPWQWYKRDELQSLNFPKANKNIVDRLSLNKNIKISENLSDIKTLKPDTLFYWRSTESVSKIEEVISVLEEDLIAKMMLNIQQWQSLNQDLQSKIQYIHFKQNQLDQYQSDDRPIGKICIAACHDVTSLNKAQCLGVDAVILSPVQKTATHIDAQPLGWDVFKDYASKMDIPVYALGGIKPIDLEKVIQNCGYGVAGISNF